MSKYIYILIILFSFLACNNDTKPESVLDQKTYKQVLKEIILVDLIKNQKTVKDSLSFNPLQLVYNKYHLDSIKMKKNTDYYAKHPDILEKIYKELKEEFQNQQDALIDSDSISIKASKTKLKKNFDSITLSVNILGSHKKKPVKLTE